MNNRNTLFGQRFCASAIDYVFLAVLLGVGFSLVAQLAILGKSNQLMELLAFMIGLLTLAAPVLYFWLSTWWSGQTLGKRFLSLRVVNENGRTPYIGQSFLREVVIKFTFSIFGFMYLLWSATSFLIIRDKQVLAWHDKIAATYVVKSNCPLEPSRINAAANSRDWREIISLILIGVTSFFILVFLGSLFIDYFAEDSTSQKLGDGRPISTAMPLSPQFLQIEKSMSKASKDEWQRLLQINHGRARVIPLSTINPAKDLLFFIPGIGVNFQDAHEIAQLDDEYQVIIGIYNRNYPLDRNAQQMTNAIEAFIIYRDGLVSGRLEQTKPKLNIIGHSLGGQIATLTLANLNERGHLGNTSESLFSGTTFINIDAPWRGFDIPWIFTLPGVKHVAREILPKLPLSNAATRSALSVINRTSSMNAIAGTRFPNSIKTHLVSVVPYPDILSARTIEPVDGWYSEELALGELEIIQSYLQRPEDLNALDQWEWGFLFRRQNLQQLFLTLQRDENYPTYEAKLQAIATDSNDLNQFRIRYDDIIAKIVDTFRGQHTHFMWENARFQPWLRSTLAENPRKP
jgi:uncharacterized RDD family membrane protein YckC/pimeloyl-ACP methyl ester carboxylesterase